MDLNGSWKEPGSELLYCIFPDILSLPVLVQVLDLNGSWKEPMSELLYYCSRVSSMVFLFQSVVLKGPLKEPSSELLHCTVPESNV